MIGLLSINLALLVFDWLFAWEMFRGWLSAIAPQLTGWYGRVIHARFLLIDLCFVAIFATEFLMRWLVAIRTQRYLRWYFFPFANWYEVLGLLPAGGFRLFRLLRVVGILIRLDRMGVINLSETALGSFALRYYDIFSEEVTNKVIVNVMARTQAELERGQPLARTLVEEVVLKRRGALVEEFGSRVESIVDENYQAHRAELRGYVRETIDEAVSASRNLGRFERIPMLGSMTVRALERTISDIVFHVIDEMAADLASPANRVLVEQVFEAAIDALLVAESGEVSNQLLIDAIEVIKGRVQVQQWKQKHFADELRARQIRDAAAAQSAGSGPSDLAAPQAR